VVFEDWFKAQNWLRFNSCEFESSLRSDVFVFVLFSPLALCVTELDINWDVIPVEELVEVFVSFADMETSIGPGIAKAAKPLLRRTGTFLKFCLN